MSVILLILKIIGIVLLALLGILFLLVCLVLFVPVRYQISGELEDEKTIHGRVSWLLRLVSWRLVYEKDEIKADPIRICGIPLKFKKKENTTEDDAETDIGEESEIDVESERNTEKSFLRQ